MAADEEKDGDFYAVLGLDKECSDLELRNAYKSLAMRWHPDKCSSSGNTKTVEEAKEKFQEIQKAYSVLSDANKRFLYDVGVYDNDENGMGDFLGEMAQMINQTKSNEDGQESFEELQRLFVEMFQDEIDSGFGGQVSFGFCGAQSNNNGRPDRQWHCSSSLGVSSSNAAMQPPFGNGGYNKRGNPTIGGPPSKSKTSKFNAKLDGFDLPTTPNKFCFGLNDVVQSSSKGISNSKRRNGRKQRTSSNHDVSSNDDELAI